MRPMPQAGALTSLDHPQMMQTGADRHHSQHDRNDHSNSQQHS
jgi:hypothetical protein